MVKSTRTKQMVARLSKALGPKVVPQKKQKRRVRNKPPQPVFGPISTIDTAPVAIGNSITGATPVVIPIEDGQRVQGRDFLMSVNATKSTIVDWTLVAASPVAPACMIASTLKHFSSTYAHFMVHGVAFHYITSASTATSGSVMFYVNKDRSRPALPTDSTNFMSAVLSDHNTVIGPLWKNCTASYFPEPIWYSTEIFDGESLIQQCPGEAFVYTKSANAEVPGYILIDYDISFRGLSLNPKSTLLPVSRMKYTEINLAITSAVVVLGTTIVRLTMDSGLLLDGVTTSASPTGSTLGDVYKVVMNQDDAVISGSGASVATILNVELQAMGALNASSPITDGFTCYGVVTEANVLSLCPNYASAITASNFFTYGLSSTVTIAIPAFVSLCGSVAGLLSQASI